MVEAVTVWGYAMFVWIPVSVRAILSVLPEAFLEWTRFRSSALFLSPFFAGFYPELGSLCPVISLSRTSTRSSSLYVNLVFVSRT